MMKSDLYEIEATVRVKYKVVFDRELTFAEAKQAFIDDEYDDIIDEEPLDVVSVDRIRTYE